MYRELILSGLVAVFACCGNSTGSGPDVSNKIVPVFPIEINVKEEYPRRTLAYEDVADISYIPLEKTPGNFLEFQHTLFYTENDIFVDSKHCVQRYGHDGKFKNNIGRQGRGPGELAQFIHYMVDTIAREVYMFDNGQQKTIVFDYDGALKREFREADAVYLSQVELISGETLIIGRQLKAWGDRPMQPGRLFAEISKEDGRELRKLGPYVTEENGRNMSTLRRSYLRFKDEIIVAHNESDTIYSFRPAAYPDLVFEHRYILTPHKFCSGEIRYDAGVLFESDKYAFFYHAKTDMALMKSDRKNMMKRKNLLVDKASGEIWELDSMLDGKKISATPRSANKDGIAFSVLFPHLLIDLKEKGEITDPRLKEIAENISEDSNPVLVIFEFR